MNADFERVEETISVPKETGVEGFIVAMREVLKKPRVQEVKIDARGKMSVTRFVRVGEPRSTISVEFESVTPYAAVRSGHVIELLRQESDEPLTVLAKMLERCAADQMYPVAFIIGAKSSFFEWVKFPFRHGTVLGLRVFEDRHVGDDVLILASSYGPDGDLVDVQNCYKIALPLIPPEVGQDVEVPTVKIEEEGTTT